MNLLYTLAWHGPAAEEDARHLYNHLRMATMRGERFPFGCPYEVALAQQRSTDGEWIIAILAMRGGILGDLERTETIIKLEDWFSRSGADGIRGGQTRPADHLKVASELGLTYAVTESFGTFVGEPEDAAAKKPSEAKPEPVKTAAEPVVRPPETLSEAVARAAATTPPPAGKTVTVNPETAKSCAAWAGGAAIALGGLAGLFGLLLALLFVIGQFASEPSDTTMEDFFLIMACFPLPMLIFAAAMIVIGIIVIRQVRKKPAPVAPL